MSGNEKHVVFLSSKEGVKNNVIIRAFEPRYESCYEK